MPSIHQQHGNEMERLACDYLVKQGLECVQKNYRSPVGEIDLVMQESEQLVFVEVRFRKSTVFGDGRASVTTAKQKKIARTAAHYLTRYRERQSAPCRFDVMGLQPRKDGSLSYQWVKNAFYTPFRDY